MLKLDSEQRLQAQVAAGEAADEAMVFVSRVFAATREEAYREMEGAAPDMPAIRAKLLVMRDIEDRLRAYINSGQAAVLELTRGGDKGV